MKKASRIIISVLLIVAMIVPASVFVKAETNVITTPISQSETNEYYNLKEGLYTKKTVEGPDKEGNYKIELEAYTSDVRYLTADNKGEIDIMVLMDNSNSMLGSKRKDAISAIKTVFSNLVNNYGAGTKYKANVCMYTFANSTTHRFGYRSLNKNSLSDINSKVSGITGNLIGGTDTGLAFKTVYEKISERKKEYPDNTQVLFFLTDGVPALGVTSENSTFGGPGNNYANEAIKYDNLLKNMGVGIYCLGINSDFKAIPSQTDDTLCDIITSGYNNDKNKGEKIGIREATIFLNVLSSGWKVSSNKSFDWRDYDNKQANKKVNDTIGIPYDYPKKSEHGRKIYKYWAQSDNSWQNIPSFYTRYIDAENPDTKYYYGNANEEKAIAEALSEAVLYAISTHVVSEGSLLGEYSLKDTVSDYFEIIQGTTKVYKVPYDYKNGSYIGDVTSNVGDTQHGERNRAWGAPIDITSKIAYTETEKVVEVLSSPENSSVVDTCIVDDIIDSSNEKHGGNKLRVTFEIRPKDSFMGGKSVPTNDFNNSGIFKNEDKAVQNFVTLISTAGGKDTLSSDVPTMPVKLVNGKVSLDNDNVKIGYIYSLDSLGENNLKISYEGRYTDTKYTLLLNSDKECSVYSDGTELIYSKNKIGTETEYHKPSDYVMVAFGNSYADSSSNGIVADSKYIQFNSSGITYSGGSYHQSAPSINKYIYLLWSGMENQETIVNDRFPEYNKTNEDSKAEQEAGIVDDIFYTKGQESARQFDVPVNVNVFVPAIKVNDAVISKASGTKYPVSSDKLSEAFDNLNIQSRKNGTSDNETLNYSMNNGQLSNLALAQMDAAKNNGFVYLVANNNTVNIDESKNKSVFIEDVYSIAQTDINAYVKRFADKNGVEKSANSVIADKDQIQLTLMYDGFENILDSLSVNAPFKLTVDEFYATNECNICGNQYMSMFLGYNAQIHQTTNSITVVKTGCDSAHTNSSFVFSVLGFKEKADGSGADINSVKVLNNFTIQGNGQRTVTVDTSAYQYYCVVEDSNALNDVSKGWTWDYSGVSINGIDWKSVENHVFQLQPDEANTVTFENKYNKDNSTLHYASAYAVNTMSNETVESISSDN
jgi:hypothetical protein